MTNRTRNLLLFVLLAGAAFGTWVLARDPSPAIQVRTETTPPSRSFYLDGAVLFATDLNGLIPYQVEAERVEQEEAGDQLTFDAMRVTYAPETDVNWNISAARGVASENLGQLHMQDDVLLILSPDNNQEDRIFRTSDLLLDADEFLVVTEAMVSLRMGTEEFVGEGLSVDLKTDAWKFGSEVIIGSAR